MKLSSKFARALKPSHMLEAKWILKNYLHADFLLRFMNSWINKRVTMKASLPYVSYESIRSCNKKFQRPHFFRNNVPENNLKTTLDEWFCFQGNSNLSLSLIIKYIKDKRIFFTYERLSERNRLSCVLTGTNANANMSLNTKKKSIISCSEA